MENSKENKQMVVPKKKISTTPVRVLKSTAKTIRAMLNKLNKKEMGRRLTVDDIVSKAISLIGPEHIEELKHSSYSSKDLVELRYREFCKAHGPVSEEEYFAHLLSLSESPSSK